MYFRDSVAAAYNSGTNDYPTYYSTIGKPLIKEYGFSSERGAVANSILELNAVAWGLKKVAAQLP